MSEQSGVVEAAASGRRCHTRGGRLAGFLPGQGRGRPVRGARALAYGLSLVVGRGTLTAALSLDLRRWFVNLPLTAP